jgi:hypothetical protein
MINLIALNDGTAATVRLEMLVRTPAPLVRIVAGPSAVLAPEEARELGRALLAWAEAPAPNDPQQLTLM